MFLAPVLGRDFSIWLNVTCRFAVVCESQSAQIVFHAVLDLAFTSPKSLPKIAIMGKIVCCTKGGTSPK